MNKPAAVRHVLRSLLSFNQYQRDLWVESIAANIQAGTSVLDIGAGSAPYRNLFEHAAYKTHDLCQLDDEQLMGRKGYGAIDYVSDIKTIPVSDNSFDYILCTEVLEHVPEPIEAIREMVRICKPGGRIFVSAPLGSGLHQTPFHFYGGYTPFFYKIMFENVGAKVLSISPNGGFFRLYAQESLRFLSKANPSRIELPFLLRLIWAPFWLIAFAWTPILVLLGRIMNAREKTPDFTIGYHVVAEKLR